MNEIYFENIKFHYMGHIHQNLISDKTIKYIFKKWAFNTKDFLNIYI